MQRLSFLQINELPSALRVICVNSFFNMAGSAAMTGAWAVYATKFLNFDTLWLTITGSTMSLGMLVGSLLFGRVTDRVEPRYCIVVSNVIFGASMLLLYWFPTTIAAACCFAIAGCASSLNSPSKSILIVRYTSSKNDLSRTRSITTSWSYLGTATGTALGLVVLSLDTSQAYSFTIAVNAVSNLVVAVLALRIPLMNISREHHRNPSRPVAFCDKKFVALCLLLNLPVLATYAVNTVSSIWLVRFTALPTILIGIYQAIQNVTGATLHTILTKKCISYTSGIQEFIKFVIVSCCASMLLPLSAIHNIFIGSVLFLAVSCLSSISIIGMNGAAWAVSYAVRKDAQQGEYESINNFIDGTCGIAFPYITTPLCGTSLYIGWITISVISMAFAGILYASRSMYSRASDA